MSAPKHKQGPWQWTENGRLEPFWQEQKDKHVVGDALISGGAMMLEVRRTEWPSGTHGGSLNWDLTAFGSHAEVGHMPAEISPELRAEFERWKNLIAAAPELLKAARQAAMSYMRYGKVMQSDVSALLEAIAKAEGGAA